MSALALVATVCSPSGGAEIQNLRMFGPTELAISTETCNAELTVSVEESASEVRIEVHFEGGIQKDCADGAIVELDEPLGDRQVYDVVGERYVPLQVDD